MSIFVKKVKKLSKEELEKKRSEPEVVFKTSEQKEEKSNG